MDDHKYLIIGAGPVGLAVAKSLKMERIPYHQVDANDDVGGNWYNGTPYSTHILSSRAATEYPDFPMPNTYPDFPSRSQMHEYYKMYATHYDLWKNIIFGKQVVSVLPVQDNLWMVDFKNEGSEFYKAVIICNGHHWCKSYPNFTGIFTGESFHSKDYKTPDQLRNKKVLVVGAGNSAFDIASDAARVGASSLLSVRRGIWVFPKTIMGRPLSTVNSPILPLLPDWLKEFLVKLLIRLTNGSHKEYGLPKPTIKVFDRHPTINTDTLMLIKHGKIKVKGAVKELNRNEVIFEDGTSESIDLIVYATGFDVSFPFLPSELNRVDQKVVKVYGYSMYQDFKGIYVVGWFQPRGGVGSLIAPYANLLTQLIKIQENVNHPVGRVLQEMGERLPASHLIGGPQLLRWIRKITRKLPEIEKKGKRIDAQRGEFNNPVVNKDKSPKQKINNTKFEVNVNPKLA